MRRIIGNQIPVKILTGGDSYEAPDDSLTLPAFVDLTQESDTETSESGESSAHEEADNNSPLVDMEDNLTYHEDTLSIFKCTVDTPLGNNLQLWFTTES